MESYKQQMKDSDTIFIQITTGAFHNFEEARRAVCAFYIMDTEFSRSGISHALKRLEKFYGRAIQ